MGKFELIEEVREEKKLIERLIRLNGTDPEQNYGYFLAHDEKDDKCVLIKNGKYAIQATLDRKQKSWVMIGAPIAPREEQVQLLHDALSYLSRKRLLDKFVAEFETSLKKEADEKLSKKFKVYTPSCVLYWPVYSMKSWNGNLLKGKEWKKLRNLLNNFKKNHRVRLIDSVDADKKELKDVVMKWVKIRNQTGMGINRKDSNRTDYEHYINMIDNKFAGCRFAKTVMVDGKASSITAGWEIPNSDKGYYSGVGLYDLAIKNLGVYANWRDLVMLKKAGYNKVDFGGSPKPLLHFKKKFKPNSIYRTYIFTIGKKN